jgi:hypothetical protein
VRLSAHLFLAWEAFSVPYQFDFDTANHVLRGRFQGAVTDEILKEFYAVSGEYVARTAPRATVTDFLTVTSFDVSPETIRHLASLPPALSDPNCPRFIVADTPQIFGLARMFELQGQNTRPNLHVVRTMKEVCVILGVPELNFQPMTA